MRNVWCAPWRGHCSLVKATFKICYDFPHSGRSCPSHHSGHNVWRASLSGSEAASLPPSFLPLSLSPLPSSLPPSSLPLLPAFLAFLSPVWPAPERTRKASSIGGSAMHVKKPDDVGREAGIGRTQSGDELTLFRACP